MNFSRTLKSSKAAIDLASIMIGVLVISLIGGVIAATVFAVIPWAQDSAAKHQLANIQTAQDAQRGLSIEAAGVSSTPSPAFITVPAFINAYRSTTFKPLASGDSSYANLQGLSDRGVFKTTNGVDVASGGIWDKEARICVSASNAGTGSYTSAVVSDSGRTFIASDSAPKPLRAEVGDDTCLGPIQDNGLPSITNAVSNNQPAVPVVDASAPWVITDDNLRAQVKTILGVDEATDLTLGDAARLSNANGSKLVFTDVVTASGLEKATNLTILEDVDGIVLWDTNGFDNIATIEKRLWIVGNDNIMSLSGFNNLKSAKEVSVARATNLESVTGLRNLESAENIVFGMLPSVQGELSLPSLKTVNSDNFGFGFEVSDSSFGSLSLPKLENARFINIWQNASLESIAPFASLTEVRGDLGLAIQYNASLVAVDFPVLKTVNDAGWSVFDTAPAPFVVVNNSSLVSISAPQLERVYGPVIALRNGQATLDVSSLVSSTRFEVEDPTGGLLLNKSYVKYFISEGTYDFTEAPEWIYWFNVTDASGRVFTSAPDYFASHPGV